MAFYTKHLGFKLEQQSGSAFARVSNGNLSLLLSGTKASGSRPMPDGRKQEPGGWNRVVVAVDDLPARVEARIALRKIPASIPTGNAQHAEYWADHCKIVFGPPPDRANKVAQFLANANEVDGL